MLLDMPFQKGKWITPHIITCEHLDMGNNEHHAFAWNKSETIRYLTSSNKPYEV